MRGECTLRPEKCHGARRSSHAVIVKGFRDHLISASCDVPRGTMPSQPKRKTSDIVGKYASCLCGYVCACVCVCVGVGVWAGVHV